MEIKNTIKITKEEENLLLQGAKLWNNILGQLGIEFTYYGELIDSFSFEKCLDGQELFSGDGETAYRFKVSER